ncbi:bifunctional 3-dehydroquinate dehydratase/shikimate dehydrogenase [Quercus suber]|uniref:Bifunctional 3-dehydroquinate dehydratase/shikimate dehydrogenase n=1 Tax=Quercus suber TaxID=58331 RepID=A0AAW0MCC4_QUESU
MDSTNVLLASSSAGLEMGSREIGKNQTLLCAPIMAETVDKMVINMDKAKQSDADLKRLDALRLAMEFGADYIDVELQVAREFNESIFGKKPEKFKVIVSSHNYHDTPSVEDLGNLVARIQEAGADIVKIATTALEISDVACIFQITVHSQVPIIAIVMGERGFISRILCPKFGGFLSFGTIESGVVSAPGQPTMKDLLTLYNFREIGPDTKVFGIIGKPVGHSKSPILYNEAFKSVGFNGVYVPFLVDDVAKFLQTYSSIDFAGFSCTIPHKEDALKCCDEVDPVAKSIGAVNCVIRRPTDGKMFGYNTDYVGAISAIEDGLRGSHNISATADSPLAGKFFVVIGAGGAGKALAYGAKEKGARVVIANRTYDRARELANTIGGDAVTLADLENFHPVDGMILANTTSIGMQPKVDETPIPKISFCHIISNRARELANTIGGDAVTLADLENFHPVDGMILANTTSIGMQPKVDETPIPKHALRSYSLVFDAVYTPKITRLLREAEESGATIVSGLEMFIGQAYEQFERFTGLPAPKQLFRKIMANS